MTATANTLRQDVRVISLVAVAHGLSHFYQLVVAVLFPLIKDDLGVGYAALGATTALFYTVSGVCQTLAGFVVDRFGARRVLLGGLTLCSLGVLMAGLAGSYPMLVVAAVVAGVGNSVFHPADFAILNARVNAQRLGYAFSFHGIGGTLGWALAPAFAYGVSALYGWSAALVASSLLGLAMVALIIVEGDALRVARHAVAAGAGRAGALAGDLRVLLRRPVMMCFLYFMFLAAALIGVQNFGVAGLIAVYGTPVALASSALTAFLLGSAAGILAGGVVAARAARHDRVAAAGMASSALFMLLIASATPAPVLLVPLFALAGFSSGITGPSRDLLVRAATPAGSTGKVYGFVYSGLDVGSMATPVIFGLLIDRGHPQTVFYLVFGILLATVFTVLNLSRPARMAAETP